MAKGQGRTLEEPGVGPDHPADGGALPLSWKRRLSTVAFVAVILVMGFALHGSITGRLIEGAMFITSIAVLWMTGTSPTAPPTSQRAPGADGDG